MMKIVLIPAYEPDHHLIDLLKEISKDEFDVVVVDDGSGKDYFSIFDEALNYAKVIQYDVNQGKGFALKKGFQYIREHYVKDYVVVTMDSDGQHQIIDAKKLCTYAEEHLNTLVLGMRKRDGHVPFRSKIGNAITRGFYLLITGLDVYDTQTGLRAFSYRLMDYFLKIDGNRFEYEMNVLLSCSRDYISIHEIPIETIYIENNRHSHFKTFRDSFYIYKEILKFSFVSFLSFLIDYLCVILLFLGTNSVIISNVIARVISSLFNYFFNKRFVFKSSGNVKKTFIRYYLLVVFILVFNTVILNFLVYQLSFSIYVAKIITEIILFFVSWIVQKRFIFNH